MSRHDEDTVSIAKNVAIREGFVVETPREVMQSIRTLLEQPDDGDRNVVDERELPWSSVDNQESTDLATD